MAWFRTFAAMVLWVQVAAVAGLMVAGAALTWAEGEHRHGETFFSYCIAHLDLIPAWFAATLALMAVNGFWTFRLASFEGRIIAPRGSAWGPWGAYVPLNPLRLFAVNLVAIPALLGVFMLMRAVQW